MCQPRPLLKVTSAKKVTIAQKDRQKERQFFVQLVLSETFLELENLKIVQFALLAITVPTKQWNLSRAQSDTIAQSV
jgi:hypothetical protein